MPPVPADVPAAESEPFRSSIGRPDFVLADYTEVVAEWFRVVERLDA